MRREQEETLSNQVSTQHNLYAKSRAGDKFTHTDLAILAEEGFQISRSGCRGEATDPEIPATACCGGDGSTSNGYADATDEWA